LLEYLSKFAQKAYREIIQITNTPNFLFSNDPDLVDLEGRNNYRYLHGFTRLMKNNRIENEVVASALLIIEERIEDYLKNFYKNKSFIVYIYGDSLIPAFTLTVVSNHNNYLLNDNLEMTELVDWFKNNACFNGLEIIEGNEEAAEDNEVPNQVISKRYYSKIINT